MEDYGEETRGRGYAGGRGRFDPSRGRGGRGRFDPSRGRGRGRMDPSRGRGRGRGRYSSFETTVDSALSTPRSATPKSFHTENLSRRDDDSAGRGTGRGEGSSRGSVSYDNSGGGRSSYDGRGSGRFYRGGRGSGRSFDSRGYHNSEGRDGRFYETDRGSYQKSDADRGSERESFFDRPELNNNDYETSRSEAGGEIDTFGNYGRYVPQPHQERFAESDRYQDNSHIQRPDTFPEANRQEPKSSFASHQPERVLEGNHQEYAVSHQSDRYQGINRVDSTSTPNQYPDNYQKDINSVSIAPNRYHEDNRKEFLTTQYQSDRYAESNRQDFPAAAQTSDRFSDNNHQLLISTSVTENHSRAYRFNAEPEKQDRDDPFIKSDSRVYKQDNRFQEPEIRIDHEEQSTSHRHDNIRKPSDRFISNDDTNTRVNNYDSGRVSSDRYNNTADKFDDDHSTSSGGRGRGYYGRGRGPYGGRIREDVGRDRFNREDSDGRMNDTTVTTSHESGGRGRFGDRGGRFFRDGRGRIPFDPSRGRGRSNFRGGGRGRGRDDGRGFDSGRGSDFGGGRWSTRVNTYDRNESFDAGENELHMTTPRSPRTAIGGRERSYNEQPSSPRGNRGHESRGHSSNGYPYYSDSLDDGGITRKRTYDVNQSIEYYEDKRSRDEGNEPSYDRRGSREQQEESLQDNRQQMLQQPQQLQHQQQSIIPPQPPLQQQQIDRTQLSDYSKPVERQDPRLRYDPRERLDPRSRIDARESPPLAPVHSTSWSAPEPMRPRNSPLVTMHTTVSVPPCASTSVSPFNDVPSTREASHHTFQSYPVGGSGRVGGGRVPGRGFSGGRGRFDRSGRTPQHFRQGPLEGGQGGWGSTRYNDVPGDREGRSASYASLAMDGPNPFRESEPPQEQQPEPVRASPVQELPPEPDVVPPSPPPEPAEPSAFTVAMTRMVDLESQLDFAYAKHLQLIRQTQLVKAQVETLRELPVGREAFQDDIDALIEAHEKLKREEEERKQEAEENCRREAEEAKKLEEAALRGRLASEDTTDEGLIEE